MAAESSSASAGRSGSGATADSYIGSLISLTSKSEIRYEGILYNINTEESSIGLRNVRSFGTEGRKKDGPQVPPGEKIYEYILFRGSDIKDLQVKSSPPVQTAQAPPSINSDPAIIQSHYSRPPSTTVPSAVSESLPLFGSHAALLGIQGSTFQGGLPLYQPGGNMSSWGPSPPPNANGGGLAMPMYWPGYYGTPNGLPQLHQQSLLRPPSGLAMPPSMQHYPYSGSSVASGAPSLQGSNLTEYPSHSTPITSSSLGNSSSLPTSTMPLSISTMEHATIPSATSSLISNKATISAIPGISASLPALSPLAPVSGADLKPVVPSLPSKSNAVLAPVLQQPIKVQPVTAVAGTPGTSFVDTPTLPLVTPGQFLPSGPASVSLNQPSQTAQKDVEVVKVSTTPSDPPAPLLTDAQPPILPLPPAARSHRPNGAPYNAHHNYRGHNYRGRGGRGNGMTRPVTRFAEDFDFEAMNEKFNKDEVWGHLGKSNKHSKEGEGDGNVSDEDYSQDEYEAELPKVDIKPVYNKDDFFDSLSSVTAHNEPNNGWTRFSEQKKIDTETFGDFSRYRGGHGGRGPFRGGRSRGSSYGRGYGYNYAGRGRGRGVPSRDY